MSKPVDKCIHCASSPMSHGLLWFNESMLIVITPVNRWVANRWFYKYLNALVEKFLIGFAYLLKLFGILKFNNDRSKFTIERGGALWDEAILRGYQMENAQILGKHVDFYRVRLPSKTLHFSGLPRPGYGSEAETWVDDKLILKEKLNGAGVAVSKGYALTTWEDAKAAFSKLAKPLIVKPRQGSRARHTTINVFTLDQLREAFFIAKQICHWVMVEEMLEGGLYRGTVIGGALAGVLGWEPPRVTGDGIKTVAELIERKNANRDSRVAEVSVTPELVGFIARSGYSVDSVLPEGATIDLYPRMGAQYGGTSSEITDIIHPALQSELEKAAEVINDSIVGFDFLIKDPTTDPKNQRWGIIEANGLPFIQVHNNPLYGKPNNIAKHIWDLFDKRS